MHDRAAQFAPFAALVGYDDAVAETARLTESRPELDEQEQQAINERETPKLSFFGNSVTTYSLG